jgi:DNA-binding protein HU-beta
VGLGEGEISPKGPEFTDRSIIRVLKKGNNLTFPGFETSSLAKKKARMDKNRKTGEKIKIPESKVAKFKSGNLLR